MSASVPNLTVYEQARQEHEMIRERLKFLHRQLEQQQVPLNEVERLLKELRDCLNTHFHNEEREGFFDQIVTRAPQLSQQADSLTREHVELLQDLDALILFAECGSGQPLCWQTLTLRFQDFMKKLMHHESEENGMLQQAYVDDLGTKD